MTRTSDTQWKYCYWVDGATLQNILIEIQGKGIEINRAQQNPCEVLRGEIGYAEPHVWDVICKFDAAPWYHASKQAGKNLVVSSSPLGKQYEPFLETTIALIPFSPSALPSVEELAELAQDKNYTSREPGGWGTFPPEMGEAIVQGLTKLTGTPPAEHFSDLLQTWTAVHANFVNPHYRAGEEFLSAPYSVADTVHISSCCVELFNLLDTKEPALLVRPCIGSVIVQVLEKDAYYRINLQRNE